MENSRDKRKEAGVLANWLSGYFLLNPLAVTVQFMAIPTYLLCFWMEKKKFLVLNIITSVFYAIGYICMFAWSGLTLATMTAIICLIVYFLDKSSGANELRAKKIRWLLLVGFGLSNIIIYLIFDSKIFAIIMVAASLLNYYNYFLMKENNIKTKFIFVISHIFIVIYESVVGLYFFAVMDFMATLSIIGSLIGALCLRQRKRKSRQGVAVRREFYGK